MLKLNMVTIENLLVDSNLNTSHVKVKHFDSYEEAKEYVFKYISC